MNLKRISIVVLVIAILLYGLRVYNVGCRCNESPDLTNKVAIVTGGNAGIGYETSLGLAKRKAHVIIACRDLTSCSKTAQQISKESNNPKVEAMLLNLASLKSIRQFAENFQTRSLPIHILVLNAGVWMGDNKTFTDDGFEMTFGVNHLGHFYLTNLLLPQIKSGKARVVTVSSGLNNQGVLDFGNLQSEKSYGAFAAYCNSKLANVLFANQLSKELEGTGATSTSLHPGVIVTQLHRELSNPIFKKVYEFLGLFMKNSEEGAQTTLTAAVSKKFEGVSGVYLAECNIAKPNPIAEDKEAAKKLWEVSKVLLKI